MITGPARSIALYFLAILIVSGANFLSVPLLLLLLGHSEFGKWALLEPLLLTVVPIVGLGVHLEVLRKAGSRGTIAKLLPVSLGSAPLFGLVVGLTACGLGLAPQTALWAALTVTAEGVLAFFISVWRAQDRPGYYAAIEGGRALVLLATLTCILVLMPGKIVNTTDYLFLRFLVATSALTAALYQVRPSLAIDVQGALTAIRYGTPIVLASMLSVLLLNVDRYALAASTDADVPRYVAHVRLAYVLAVAASAFSTWFAPAAMRMLNKGEGAHPFFIRSTNAYVGAVLIGAGNMWLLAPIIWPMLFPTLELDLSLFACVVGGAAVFCLANPLSLGSLLPGKTLYALVATGLSLGAAVAGSWIMAEWFGAIGAAVSRGIAVVVYVSLFTTITVRTLGIRYPWPTYLGLSLLAVGLCFALATFFVGNHWIDAGGRLLAFNGAFACGLWLAHLRTVPSSYPR